MVGPEPSEVTRFIRGLSEKLTLGQMIERAREAGYSVTFAQADSMRRQVGLRYTKRDGTLSKKYKNAPEVAQSPPPINRRAEFRRLVILQGCTQIRGWLDELEACSSLEEFKVP